MILSVITDNDYPQESNFLKFIAFLNRHESDDFPPLQSCLIYLHHLQGICLDPEGKSDPRHRPVHSTCLFCL